MHRVVFTLSALLASVFLLVAGSGLQGTLLTIRGQMEGFQVAEIGFVGTSYFIGFLGGCIWAGRLIRRVGHIRSFAILAAIAAQAVLMHSMVVEPVFWFVLRAISGFSFAGLAMIIESWLNENATNENRGRVISIYRIVDLSGILVGQILFALTSPLGFTLFAGVACLLCMSLVPVSATTSTLPRQSERMSINVKGVWNKAQTAVTTCFVIGLANSSFWTLAPLFALELSGSQIWVSIFMSAMVIGGAIAVWPIGAWSDRVDRRIPIFACTMLVIATSLFATVISADYKLILLVSGFLYGAGALPQYGLAIAHANDSADADAFVEVSSTLLFVFAVASILGPSLASLVMGQFGPTAMFAFIGAIHVLSASHTLFRMMRHQLEDRIKTRFVPVPRTTQEVFDMDPRSDDVNQ